MHLIHFCCDVFETLNYIWPCT